LGLFGLIASFHGIILGYSRQIYALSREGYLPRSLAVIHPRFRTPHRAILAGGVIGIAAIYSDQWIQFAGHTLTEDIVTLSVFGALLMYIMSMLALLKLRRAEPDMARSYRAPFYPWFPLIALAGAAVALISMIRYNLELAGLFLGILGLGFVYFQLTHRNRKTQPTSSAS